MNCLGYDCAMEVPNDEDVRLEKVEYNVRSLLGRDVEILGEHAAHSCSSLSRHAGGNHTDGYHLPGG